MLATLAMIDASGDHMKHVRDHTRRDKQLPFRVIIDAPGITKGRAPPLRSDLS